MTINLNESYNIVVINTRKQPIATLVKKTFCNCVMYFMTRMAETSTGLGRGDELTK